MNVINLYALTFNEYSSIKYLEETPLILKVYTKNDTNMSDEDFKNRALTHPKELVYFKDAECTQHLNSNIEIKRVLPSFKEAFLEAGPEIGAIHFEALTSKDDILLERVEKMIKSFELKSIATIQEEGKVSKIFNIE